MSGRSTVSGQSLYFEAAHTFCKCRPASPFSGKEALVHGLPLVVLPFPSPSSFSMRWFLVLKVKLNLLLSFSRKIAECSVWCTYNLMEAFSGEWSPQGHQDKQQEANWLVDRKLKIEVVCQALIPVTLVMAHLQPEVVGEFLAGLEGEASPRPSSPCFCAC